MTDPKEHQQFSLRAHHICCSRFLNLPQDRGEKFRRTKQEIAKALMSDSCQIQVIEGTDMLCSVCPQRSGDECASSKGGEVKVRKWDFLLLNELDIPFDTVLESNEWRHLIDKAAPFRLCGRCQWKSYCTSGAP